MAARTCVTGRVGRVRPRVADCPVPAPALRPCDKALGSGNDYRRKPTKVCGLFGP